MLRIDIQEYTDILISKLSLRFIGDSWLILILPQCENAFTEVAV
jgi:hypothetical protein